ncbi:MAG: hypothetical protein GJ680_01670 [Alteromonadaceae bacterium]|nr:hypothetical protein [Alteromonadaceae bacterium]
MLNPKNKSFNSLLSVSLLLAMCAFHNMKVANAEETNTKAGRSTHLQVPEDFNFNSSKQVRVDVSVTDDLDVPKAGQLVQIFSIDSVEVDEEGEEVMQTTLIAIAKTDEAGWITTNIEIPNIVGSILVKQMAMEMDNARVVDLNLEEDIVVSF